MVNGYKLKLTLLQQGLLRYFFIKAGESFNARALSIALHVSQPAITKALPYLKKMELITVIKDATSKRLSISLNQNNPLITGLKRVDNLKQVYESGLYQFLYDTFPGTTVILFGSYSFGEDTINSDIDLAIINSKQKEKDLEKFEAILGRKININYFKSFKGIHKHLLNNILNGIIIRGSVEL